MKTASDINALINENIAAINRLKHDYGTGKFFTRKSQALAYKALRKKIGKHNDEIRHLRRLLIFIESTPEEGVCMMRDRLQREIQAATVSAHRLCAPEGVGKNKDQIREYLSNACVPLKKKQLAELEFILK